MFVCIIGALVTFLCVLFVRVVFFCVYLQVQLRRRCPQEGAETTASAEAEARAAAASAAAQGLVAPRPFSAAEACLH